MGYWQAISSALRAARETKRGHLGIGAALFFVVAATLRWLAGRRSSVPPVRVTGVAENAVRPAGRVPSTPASPHV